jgi:hypothetical protein
VDAKPLAEALKEGLVRYDRHLIDDIAARYTIDGERAYSFLYAQDSQSSQTKLIEEGVTVVHHNKVFVAGKPNLDILLYQLKK